MEDLKSFLDQKRKRAKKIKGKHSPLSELINKEPKILKIEDIYSLSELDNLYLFIVKNYTKLPKKRYFLAISIASHSSDLLANIAKKFLKNYENIRLIQYSLYPDTLRVNLITLLELLTPEQYESSMKFLLDLRKKYRIELMSITDKMQS